MKKYNVDVSELAENDLRDIIHYISTQLSAPMSAENMLDEIERSISTLDEFPYRHPKVMDELLATRGYRILAVKNYIAFYTIDEQSKTVNVERILYARRDWAQLL